MTSQEGSTEESTGVLGWIWERGHQHGVHQMAFASKCA